jgi:predicted dehydrogenase
MPRWWFDAQSGGGWLGASGSHIVDQVRMTLGDFAAVSAALPTVSARAGVAEDSYLVRFHLVNGVEGVLQQTGGACGPFFATTRIAGTQGTVWIEGDTVKIADHAGSRDLPVPSDLVLPPPPPPGNDPWYQYSVVEIGPYTRLFEVLRAMMDGKSETVIPVPTFADGVAEMEVLDAIRRSAANRGELVTLR